MSKNLLVILMAASVFLTAFRNPPGAARYVEMAEKAVSEGQAELAFQYYSKAVELEPQKGGHYTARGFFLLKLKRYDEALNDFSASIGLEPQNSSSYLARGLVYSDLKRVKEADADFSMACRMGSKDGCSFAGQK